MADDGAGIYTLPTNYLAITGDTITAAQHNDPLVDAAAAINARLNINGAKAMTGPLAMGSNRITGLADAIAATDGVNRQFGDGRYARRNDVATLIQFDANGDGTTLTTTEVQAAFNSGKAAIYIPDGTFRVGTITVPTTVKLIYGPGTLLQAAVGAHLLDIAGASRLRIINLKLTGAATAPTTSATVNNAINIRGSSDDVLVQGCTIKGFLYFGLYAEASTNIRFLDNDVRETYGIRFRGVTDGKIVGNRVMGTIAPATEFTVAIGLDSTDGHAFGICRNVEIAGNHVSGYANAQGVLVHAGQQVSIHGNNLVDPAVGISCNPFNASDTINNLSITGNIISTNPTGIFTANGNDGIVVAAGGVTPDPTDVLIASNIIINANRYDQGAGQGAIRLQDTNRASVIGNFIYKAYSNGIILASAENRCVVKGNTIEVVEFTTVQFGINVTGSINGEISDNSISDFDNAASFGVRVNATPSGGPLRIRGNIYDNISGTNEGGTAIGSATDRNILIHATGTSVNLGNADEVLFNSGTAITVVGFTNVIPGKMYLLRNVGAGTITIDRTSAYLNGSVSQNLTTRDAMLIVGESATLINQVAPVSVNG